jgi:hypothetical protein
LGVVPRGWGAEGLWAGGGAREIALCSAMFCQGGMGHGGELFRGEVSEFFGFFVEEEVGDGGFCGLEFAVEDGFELIEDIGGRGSIGRN